MLEKVPENIAEQLNQPDRHQAIHERGKTITQAAAFMLLQYCQGDNPPLTTQESQTGFFAFNACYSAAIIAKLGKIPTNRLINQDDLKDLSVSLSFTQQVVPDAKSWSEVSDMISAARVPNLSGFSIPDACAFAYRFFQMSLMGFTYNRFKQEFPDVPSDASYPVYSEDVSVPECDIGPAMVCHHQGKKEYYTFPKNIVLIRN